jgi:hypothetical protein
MPVDAGMLEEFARKVLEAASPAELEALSRVLADVQASIGAVVVTGADLRAELEIKSGSVEVSGVGIVEVSGERVEDVVSAVDTAFDEVVQVARSQLGDALNVQGWSPEVKAAALGFLVQALLGSGTVNVKLDCRGAFGGEYHEAAPLIAPPPPTPPPPPAMQAAHRAAGALSPLARVVLDVLRVAPGTADELARETKLPAGVVDSALAELVNSGRAVELEPRRFKAR